MDGNYDTHVDHSASAGGNYSAPEDIHSAAPGEDHYHNYDQQSYDHQQHDPHGQQEDSGNQQSGGAGAGGGSAEYSAEVKAEARQPEAPPPHYQQNQQQGGYPPRQNVPNFATAGPPPPSYSPNNLPRPNQPYPPPPQHYNPPPPDVYPPPNPGPAQGYTHPVTPPPFHQEATTTVRPPRGGGAPMGVRIAQPTIRPEIGPPEPWASEIFGCLDDCYGCPLVVIAPCIAFGQVAEIVDIGYNRCQTAGIIYAFAFFLGIPCLYSYTYRTKMRHRFNLREDPLDDFCTHFWCEWCAIAQEYRELRYRGIDPSLGYEMQQNTITQAMEAPVPPRMQAAARPQVPVRPPPPQYT